MHNVDRKERVREEEEKKKICEYATAPTAAGKKGKKHTKKRKEVKKGTRNKNGQKNKAIKKKGIKKEKRK